MKIRAIIKRPDEEYGHVSFISDTLENLQRTVGGYIETVTFSGRMRPEDDFVICGDIAVLGVDGEDFADCPLQLKEWKKMLVRKNDDTEE